MCQCLGLGGIRPLGRCVKALENPLSMIPREMPKCPVVFGQILSQMKWDAKQKTGYTTTLKLMQIMTEKGLVVRDDSKFQHIYKPAVSEEKTQKQIVGDLLERAFSGSAEKLVMRALSAKKVSAKELAKIRKMLDEMEGK